MHLDVFLYTGVSTYNYRTADHDASESLHE
jgi:hypothetical protein